MGVTRNVVLGRGIWLGKCPGFPMEKPITPNHITMEEPKGVGKQVDYRWVDALPIPRVEIQPCLRKLQLALRTIIIVPFFPYPDSY